MLNLRKKTIQDKQQTRGKQVYAIIPAAGSSQRMGGGNKLVMELHGQPILCRTLQVFEACPAIDGIVLVCRKQDQANYASLCADWNISKLHKIVEGGRPASTLCSTAFSPVKKTLAMLPFTTRRAAHHGGNHRGSGGGCHA